MTHPFDRLSLPIVLFLCSDPVREPKPKNGCHWGMYGLPRKDRTPINISAERKKQN